MKRKDKHGLDMLVFSSVLKLPKVALFQNKFGNIKQSRSIKFDRFVGIKYKLNVCKTVAVFSYLRSACRFWCSNIWCSSLWTCVINSLIFYIIFLLHWHMAKANGMRCYGHTCGRDDGHVLRKVLKFEVKGKKEWGQPKKTWKITGSPSSRHIFYCWVGDDEWN